MADILHKQALIPRSNIILMLLKLNQTYNLSLHIHIVYQLVHSRNEFQTQLNHIDLH